MFIAPEVAPSSSSSAFRDPQCTVVFDSTKVNTLVVNNNESDDKTSAIDSNRGCKFLSLQELSVSVSDDLVEFLGEGAVAIEVYGHKQANHRRNLALWDLGVIQAKTRSLRER